MEVATRWTPSGEWMLDTILMTIIGTTFLSIYVRSIENVVTYK